MADLAMAVFKDAARLWMADTQHSYPDLLQLAADRARRATGARTSG